MKKTALVFLAIFVFMSGCSYKGFDDRIQRSTAPNETTQITLDNGLTIAVEMIETKPADEGDISYISIGDSFSDSYEYINMGGNVIFSGIDGLVYVVNNVMVYDSFFDSGIDSDETMLPYVERYSENNSFIVVEMTATYNNPTDDSSKDSILGYFSWSGMIRYGEGYEGEDEIESGSIYPEVMYFSDHPREGDVDSFGQAFNVNNDYMYYRYPLQDGCSYEIVIGIMVAPELIERKNVFLSQFEKKPSDNSSPIIFVDILGRFGNGAQ